MRRWSVSDKVKKTFQELGNARHYLTPFKRVYNRLVKNSARRGIECSITYEEYIEFTKQESCHYCNDKIPWKAHGRGANSTFLDRKDSGPYQKDNVVVCCWRCNDSKSNNFSYEEWYAMTEYLRKKK